MSPEALGPFRVSVDVARVQAYARETGYEGAGVPLCYPAVWLTEPQIHAAIHEICEQEDLVPVHESQSFSYDAPLRVGESYDLAVTMRREATPPRLVLDATIATPAGAPCARLEAMLRLVPRSGFAGAGA